VGLCHPVGRSHVISQIDCAIVPRHVTHMNASSHTGRSVLQCVAVCCSVLQGVAVCCSVLQCVAVCCSVLQCALTVQ